MRFARKLTLLALAATAAMAFAAAPASAVDPIEVVNEKTGTVCSDLVSPHTSGGCVVHATGTIKFEVFIFTWFNERTCDVELEMRLGGDGTLAVDDLDYYPTETAAEQDCQSSPPITMCDTPWEGTGEESAAGVIHSVKEVCIDPMESDVCGSTLEYDIVEEAASETYRIDFVNHTLGSFCRLNGTLRTESSSTANAAIHVNHL